MLPMIDQDPNLTSTFRGPPSLHSGVVKLVNQDLSTFMAEHDRWVVDAKMKPMNRSVFEHRVLSRALDL